MHLSYPLLILIASVSAWQFPFGLGGRRKPPPKPLPLRFDLQPNCTTFLAQLNKNTTIVYNYGVNESTPRCGRDLVACLSREDAEAARSYITGIVMALPLVGTPKPKQKAFIELVEMLPNLQEVQFVHSLHAVPNRF